LKGIMQLSENKLIFRSISGSLVLKALSMIISLACTRQYIIFFGNDSVLGVWYAIVSILNWILYFDMGIGNGMRNHIVDSLEKRQYDKVRAYVSNGYIGTVVLSLFIVLGGLIIIRMVDWNQALNISAMTVSAEDLTYMVQISIIGVGVQFALKPVLSVYRAQRKTYVAGYTALATNLMIYIYLHFRTPGSAVLALREFACVYALAINIPLIVVTFIAFTYSFREARPSPRLYEKKLMKSITSLGLGFFVIQIAQLIISSTDSWIITSLYTPDDVVAYQVYYRFFSIALTVYALFSQTVWSSVTKYIAEKNGERIKGLNRMLYMFAIIGGCCCLILALFFKALVAQWMGDVYTNVSVSTAILFALWMTMQMFVNASTALANGASKLKCQAIFVPVAGVLKIILVMILSNIGMDWNAVLVSSAICLIPLLIAQSIDNMKTIQQLKK